MRVTACVVTWNSASQVSAALASLASQSHPDLELVVVDNASTDASAELAARAGVRVIRNSRNRGFAAAANQGAVAAQRNGSHGLLLCNPDVVLQPEYVARAAAVLAGEASRASVQGRLWRSTGPDGGPSPRFGVRVLDSAGHVAFRPRLFGNRGEGECDEGQFSETTEVFGVTGAAGLYRLEALDDIACDGEIFDEDLFAYFEDVDVDWRLRLRGWECWYAADAYGSHERGGIGPRRSPLVERLNFANRLLVVAKNDDVASLARAFPGLLFTTGVKAAGLAVTRPMALLRSLLAARQVPALLQKRRIVQGTATVDPAAVIQRWFEPLDYRRWLAQSWTRLAP